MNSTKLERSGKISLETEIWMETLGIDGLANATTANTKS